MADFRTLKLSILADVTDLKTKFNAGQKEVSSFTSKVGDFGKKAAIAFGAATAAAGAYAVKLAVDGVKAAIEDEQSQIKLANALRNATAATNEQISSVEDQILQMSLAKGVADDQLRPAFAALSRSTGDLTKSQELLNLALDISSATGRSLDSVSLGLSRAYAGNTTSLGRLGIGLSSAELATMSFTDIQGKLSDLFGGAADANANTFAGRMDRIKIAFDEAKESLGQSLLPIVEKFIGFITSTALPALNSLIRGFKGEGKLEDGMNDTNDSAYNLGVTIRSVAGSFSRLFNVFNNEANTGASSGLGKLLDWFNVILKALGKLVDLLDFAFFLLGQIANPKNWFKSGTELTNEYKNRNVVGAPRVSIREAERGATATGSGSGSTSGSSAPKVTGGGSGSGGSSGSSTGSGSISVPTVPFQSVSLSQSQLAAFGSLEDIGFMQAAAAQNLPSTPNMPNIDITVNGAIDSESTARQIVEILNESYLRGTGGSSSLALYPSF